jgi:hypothetical protein
MPDAVEAPLGVMTDVLDIDVEHFIPEEEEGHTALSTCACDPLRVRNVRGWYHRALHP